MNSEKYTDLNTLTSDNKDKLLSLVTNIVNDIKNISNSKAFSLIKCIPDLCRMHYYSRENRKTKSENANGKKMHPVRPIRGEIYNAYITENIGSELNGNHLVVIIQNNQGNLYSEKVNVVPIAGDGNIVNENYQKQLSNDDLKSGELTKNPSRIIVSDILTIDKARLGRKIGEIKDEYIIELNKKIKAQLGL